MTRPCMSRYSSSDTNFTPLSKTPEPGACSRVIERHEQSFAYPAVGVDGLDRQIRVGAVPNVCVALRIAREYLKARPIAGAVQHEEARPWKTLGIAPNRG